MRVSFPCGLGESGVKMPGVATRSTESHHHLANIIKGYLASRRGDAICLISGDTKANGRVVTVFFYLLRSSTILFTSITYK